MWYISLRTRLILFGGNQLQQISEEWYVPRILNTYCKHAPLARHFAQAPWQALLWKCVQEKLHQLGVQLRDKKRLSISFYPRLRQLIHTGPYPHQSEFLQIAAEYAGFGSYSGFLKEYYPELGYDPMYGGPPLPPLMKNLVDEQLCD